MLRPGARTVLAALLAAQAPAPASAQEFLLDDTGQWRPGQAPEPGTDEALIAEARSLIASGEEDAARLALESLDAWILTHQRTQNPWLPQALLARGDAKVILGDEYQALFDYEAIVQAHPASDAFPLAIQREVEIGTRYLNGLKRRFLGFRIENAEPLGEELLIRAQERLPQSQLAAQAAITLADFYYEQRQMRLAAEMYDIYVINHPDGPDARRAARRRILANAARFKGPSYDASGLIDARLLLDDYIQRYPADAVSDGVAEGLATRLDESAALQMLTTARWYLRRGDQPSTRFTLDRLLKRYPTSAAAREGLRIMEERGWLQEQPRPSPADQAAADQAPTQTTQAEPPR